MNHIIVRETASEIRAITRGALKGNWPVVIAAMAVYYIMTTTIPNLLAVLIPSASYNVYNEYLQEYITISYVSNLYSFVLSGAFSVGLCSFLLAFFRRREGNPAHIFNGFEVFFKSFALMVMQSIFIFLWGLLFIVPGIIAALRYSQAYYILAEHPEITHVSMVHSETTSGILNDIQSVGKVVRDAGRTFIVDAMSSFAKESVTVLHSPADKKTFSNARRLFPAFSIPSSASVSV